MKTKTSTNTLSGGLDDVGPADVDPTTRRIDALVSALDGHQVDLLVSDDRDLLQLAALRRLAPRTAVLMGARRSLGGSGLPLTVLLEALRRQADLGSEPLAAKAIEAAGHSADLVGLRSSGAPALLAALDDFASLVPADDSPVRRGFGEAWNQSRGGDLATLTTKLKTIDDDRATTVEACAAATVIAPSPGEGQLGIGLDGPGMHLGSDSAWTRLVDAIGGSSDVAVARRTLEDMRTLTASTRRAQRLERMAPARAGLVLEYPDPARDGDVEPARDFARFSRQFLECHDARHVTLVIRGKWDARRPGSVTLSDGASLPVVALARCLRGALGHRHRGPLAQLVFDDPELLRVENAYELRDVAYVLMATVPEAQPVTTQWLTQRVDEAVGRCEQRAADALETTTNSIPALEQVWRRDVAVRLAKYVALPEPDEAPAVALQAIDLRHLGGLCRLLDRLCHRMYDALDDELVLAATRAAEGAPSLLEWINRVQVEGFMPFFRQGKGTATTRDLHDDWGQLYNWISGSEDACAESGAPLWIAPSFTTDRSPSGPGSRLRISVAPRLPRDYRSLSFNQDVALHALLTAARLLRGPDSQPYWRLISMGLAYGPSQPRHEQLERLVHEPGAAHYFVPLGAPPSMSLSIEQDQDGYELRLTSSESRATLIAQRSFANLEHVRDSLEGLGYVMSGSMASGQGFEYVEGLGAGLAEDVLGRLRGELERQREILLGTGRCREAHLALQLPRELMPLPWELMQLPIHASGSGLEMLAERFAVGRQMWTDGGAPAVKRDPKVIRVLVVADPITNQGSELPGARMEGREVQQLCERLTEELRRVVAIECDVSIQETLTRTVLRQRLRSGRYDVLHFAGHGKFANTLDQSGWLLSDGWLTGRELSSTLSSCGAPPWLVYANACSAGLIDDAAPSQYHGNVHGMAEACIRAGVGAYVAPLWRIHDDSARLLANEFYRLLLLEDRTIGIALQRARMRVRKIWAVRRGDAGLGDISWAGMVLFGNPGARLRESSG
ncbi:CHAT domain-containing protein [Paraliomyxa miuraensis]|uniref:CHAT domain-containing protein n=1 Tax=Paraliomyxa miuraensis TaxID=376150 RepID=UPI002250C026|nr:CHAT domain-containing protein [Paraliomyxa miuraensis]MCX4242704.1 CHAT domain-containing protein [Paraliomyxa miuraensis]